MRRTHLALVLSLLATALVTALLVGRPLAAEAARLLTGADIKDESLTTKDVRNKSLLAKDFAPGELPSGPRGPEGVAGPTGPAGATGAPGGGGVNVIPLSGPTTEPTIPAYVQFRFLGPTTSVVVPDFGSVAGSAMVPMYGGPIQLDWCWKLANDAFPTNFTAVPSEIGLDSASTSQAVVASTLFQVGGTYEVGPCYYRSVGGAGYSSFQITGYVLTTAS